MKTFLFHIHTEKSYDANIKIEKLLDYVIKNKIDYFCVTNHQNFEACKIIEKLLKTKKYKKYRSKTHLIKGIEIKTEYGDIIPCFIKKEIKTRKFLEVVKKTKKQKGLLIIPHPFSSHKNLNEIVKYANGIEIFNSSTSKSRNEKALQLADKNPWLLRIAGVDAHLTSELGNALNEIELGSRIKIKQILCKSSGYIVANVKHHFLQYLNTLKKIFKK